MAKITGVVENVSTKYDKYSIQVNGNWYGTKIEYAKVKPNRGDLVEFDDGGKSYTKMLRIVNATVNSDEAAPTEGEITKNNLGRGFPIPPLDRQISIIRQNVLAHATKLVCDCPDSFDHDIDKMADGILRLAKKFEAYANGAEDSERVKELLSVDEE
jgi:hypothetical protein